MCNLKFQSSKTSHKKKNHQDNDPSLNEDGTLIDKETEKPEILESITKGNFKPLMSWLITNVHSKGCSLSTKDLITVATGEPLNAKFFKSHLQNRYLN